MLETASGLRSFLEIPYDKLEEMNLRAGEQAGGDAKLLEKEHLDYLAKEKRIKAVTVCFSDLEGRFHMLDYDKKYLLGAANNFTFDGSSIRGFTAQHESDLRLDLDWSSIRWLPVDVFGPGKVIVFAFILNQDCSPHPSDMRGRLKAYSDYLKKKEGVTMNAAAEIEGFLVDGADAEQNYSEEEGFKFISSGGYYHSLPL